MTIVPIKEMTDVLSVKKKVVDVEKDSWVRVKLGTYKGDLAKVISLPESIGLKKCQSERMNLPFFCTEY